MDLTNRENTGTKLRSYIVTAEAPGEGHPDKIADQIADAILDAALMRDPYARVACEVLTSTGLVLVGGEITTDGYIDIAKEARQVIQDIGYTSSQYGFDAHSVSILSAIQTQSSDIAQSVIGRNGAVIGAGDQGLVFGYACDETPEYMPFASLYSQRMMKKVAQLRKERTCSWMRPDAKGLVRIAYEQGKVSYLAGLVLSVQHDEHVSQKTIQEFCIEHVVKPLFGDLVCEKTNILINPSGRFIIGGPQGDTGLTGRKIIADSYGGSARHGGGAYSGKDPSKVDRSAAYMARNIAKTIVKAQLASQCEVQLSYAIGVSDPIGCEVSTFGTGKVPDKLLSKKALQVFDCSPQGIIDMFQLRHVLYRNTAVYGHFGREEFPWEQISKDKMHTLVRIVS